MILENTLQLPEFQLPSDIEITGEQIAFRDSMINLCPIGRNKNNSDLYHFNRKKFAAFDNNSSYRPVIIEYLKKELAQYIEKKNLTIALGGETSFDIGILHQDKTNAVRTLLNKGVQRIIFFGDALFEGGNDAPLQAFVDNWAHEEKCPLETIQVNGWEETIENLTALGFINK
jgi:peptide subunit release factor RF-3